MELTTMVGEAVRRGLSWASDRYDEARHRVALDGPAPCDGLVLDVDDTLIDTDSAIRTAAQTAALELWPQLSTAHRAHFAAAFLADTSGQFAGYTQGEVGFHAMRKSRIAAAAADLDLVFEPRQYRRFCAAYDPAFAGAQRLYPEAMTAVTAVQRWGVAVLLLTNSSTPGTRMKLQVLGIADRFEHVVTTDTLGFGKPDPRVFEHACALLAAPPHRCVAIGDSFVNDVAAARAAGLRALWLDRAGTGDAARAPAIRTLAELPVALADAV